MVHVMEKLKVDKPSRKGEISQSGVKFRSLCSRCNSNLLGARYDIAFNNFSRNVSVFLKTTLVVPRVAYIEGEPQKIIRAVLGHIMAFGSNRYDSGETTDVARRYFLNENESLPAQLNIYYWIYPFNDQVLIRDALRRDIRIKDHFVFWLMKFFPIAYFVTWHKPSAYKLAYPDLADYCSLGIDDVVELPLYLDKAPPHGWPEAPEKHEFILYGEGAISADEYHPSKKGGG
jgi:hypothetical protein